MAIVIYDVASALLEIIQLGAAPVAVCRGAARLQIVAVYVDLLAGLRIGTGREVAGGIAGSAADISRIRGHAAQIAIVIDDLPFAFAIVVQAGVYPVAAGGLAARFQMIAMALDVLAALRIAIARNSAISTRVSCAIRAVHAVQFAVFIGYV